MIKAKDTEFTPYKILGLSIIICFILMVLLGLAIYIPGLEKCILKYNYSISEAKNIFLSLCIGGAPLLILGVIMLISRCKKIGIAYTAITYATICCALVSLFSHFDFLLVFILPALASQMFIDKKLTIYTELLSMILFIIAAVLSGLVLKIYPVYTEGQEISFYIEFLKLLLPNAIIIFLICLLFNMLTRKTTNMKEFSIEQIKNMDIRADTMNLLMQSSLKMFATSSLNELNETIINTSKDVCTPFLINPSDDIKVYLGKSDNGTYVCTDEFGNDVKLVKTSETCDVVLANKEIGIPHVIVYDTPYSKTSNDGIYVQLTDDESKQLFNQQVEKEREYERAKQTKTEFNYTFERETNSTIIKIYSRDYQAEQKAKEKLEQEEIARAKRKLEQRKAINPDDTLADVNPSSITGRIEAPVIMRLIYFVIIDANVTVDSTLDEIINILTNNIGGALINLNLNLEFLASQREMIYSFSIVTDSRSHHTANHVKRVSEYMRVLCSDSKWGFSKKKIERISIAAMMHDVGKIYIPTEILDKKTGLTDDEFQMIKSHVTKGVELVEKCPGDIMRYAKVMIRDHHERWDGKGYLKKKGTQIDLLGRIIAVADVFDALMSPRPYKEPWPKDKVRDTIVHDKGHFDPQAIAVFTNHFNELVEIYEMYKDEEIK